MVKIGQKLHANMEGFRRAGHIYIYIYIYHIISYIYIYIYIYMYVYIYIIYICDMIYIYIYIYIFAVIEFRVPNYQRVHQHILVVIALADWGKHN